jgi:hypothetical protein
MQTGVYCFIFNIIMVIDYADFGFAFSYTHRSAVAAYRDNKVPDNPITWLILQQADNSLRKREPQFSQRTLEKASYPWVKLNMIHTKNR